VSSLTSRIKARRCVIQLPSSKSWKYTSIAMSEEEYDYGRSDEDDQDNSLLDHKHPDVDLGMDDPVDPGDPFQGVPATVYNHNEIKYDNNGHVIMDVDSVNDDVWEGHRARRPRPRRPRRRRSVLDSGLDTESDSESDASDNDEKNELSSMGDQSKSQSVLTALGNFDESDLDEPGEGDGSESSDHEAEEAHGQDVKSVIVVDDDVDNVFSPNEKEQIDLVISQPNPRQDLHDQKDNELKNDPGPHQSVLGSYVCQDYVPDVTLSTTPKCDLLSTMPSWNGEILNRGFSTSTYASFGEWASTTHEALHILGTDAKLQHRSVKKGISQGIEVVLKKDPKKIYYCGRIIRRTKTLGQTVNHKQMRAVIVDPMTSKVIEVAASQLYPVCVLKVTLKDDDYDRLDALADGYVKQWLEDYERRSLPPPVVGNKRRRSPRTQNKPQSEAPSTNTTVSVKRSQPSGQKGKPSKSSKTIKRAGAKYAAATRKLKRELAEAKLANELAAAKYKGHVDQLAREMAELKVNCLLRSIHTLKYNCYAC